MIDRLIELFKTAGRLVKVMTWYLAAMAALIAGMSFLKGKDKEFGGWYWGAVVGTCAPLIVVLLCKALPDYLRWRRENEWKHWALEAKEVPAGYFRLFPYEATDRERFQRADQEHVNVLQWIRDAKSQFLVLTGESGVGKSSLLNASVIPQLEGGDPSWLVILLRSFDDPLVELRRQLLEKGTVWDQPPTKGAANWSDIELLRRAAERLADTGKRLLLVFDQFEELVILHEQTPERVVAFRAWLDDLKSARNEQVVVLLSLRSDYRSLLERFGLPLLEQNRNWREVPSFTLTSARKFLDDSGLQLGETLREAVLAEAMAVDNTRGFVRPITLNMVGEILRVKASRPGRLQRLENLLSGYVRECVQMPRVRDHAGLVLTPLVTEMGTKRPLFVEQIETDLATHGQPLRSDVIDGCLLELSESGLVRRLNHAQDTPVKKRLWEVSHDFIARLLANVLRTPERNWWRRLRPSLAPLAVVSWVLFAALMSVWYVTTDPDRAANRLRLKFGVTVQPTDEGYKVDHVPYSSPEVTEEALTEVYRLLYRLRRLKHLELEGPIGLTKLTMLKGLVVRSLGFGVWELFPLSKNEESENGPVGPVKIDLSPLAGLKELTSLDLTSRSVSDLSPLKGLTELTTLGLSSTQVSDLTPLKGLSRLTTLKLSVTPVSNLSPLKGLSGLTMLDLRNTQVSNLSPLEELSGLTKLYLHNTQVSNLSPLAGLSGLTKLDLSNTQVSDLTPLAGLSGLTALNLRNTQVSDLTPLAGLTKLVEFYVSDRKRLTIPESLRGVVKEL